MTYYALGLAEGIHICFLLIRSPIAVESDPVVSTSEIRPQLSHTDHATTPLTVQNRLAGFYRPTMVLGLLVMIGGLIPLAGVIYPLRYPPKTSASLVDDIVPYLSKLHLKRADVDAFIKKRGAFISNGRGLYPRFYRQGGGQLFSYIPFLPVDYPRTIFILIGPSGYFHVVLPRAAPEDFPNASDAIVLGCKMTEPGYIIVNAVAVVLTQQGVSYARTPRAPLSCPLPEPVCDKSGSCR